MPSVLLTTQPMAGTATLKAPPRAAVAPGHMFCSGGRGGIGPIVGEATKHAMTIGMAHAPYKGGASKAADVIAVPIPSG